MQIRSSGLVVLTFGEDVAGARIYLLLDEGEAAVFEEDVGHWHAALHLCYALVSAMTCFSSGSCHWHARAPSVRLTVLRACS